MWHTRNTNLQLLSTGSWLLNMQLRKVHWRFLERSSQNSKQTQWRVHLFHISPVAPPSHHVRPVASVPSLRAAAVVVLRLDGGARGEQRLDHLQVAFPSRHVQRPVASVRRAPLEMATGRAKSHELVQRISEDFGPEKMGVWSCSVHHF